MADKKNTHSIPAASDGHGTCKGLIDTDPFMYSGQGISALSAALNPAIKPVETLGRNKDFSTIRQGTSTNTLTKMRAVEGKNLKIDPVTGDATIKDGNFILTIAQYAQLTDPRASTYQLLDALLIELTESGSKSPTVMLPLSEYMERRGLKDRKETKAQVIEDIKLIGKSSISGEEKIEKKTESYSLINIADSVEVKRNGDIVFTFGNAFYNMLLRYPVMKYPRQLQTLNSRKNPNSYFFLRKIAVHKNMNVGKKNEDIISVKTLMESSPYIPSYEEVMSGTRALSRKIIEPFERDMDALSETLSWHYCHSLDQPLTQEELDNMNYGIFSNLLVRITWKNYPDQTARLERKAERVQQSKQAKKKKTAKKKTTE